MLSNDRNLIYRARVFSRSVVAVTALVLSWGADSNVVWAQCEMDTTRLSSSDGSAFDEFGTVVAVSSTGLAVVGSPQDDDNGTDSGSAYVFQLMGSSWTQQQKLLPSDGAASDRFGTSVAIDGDVIVVGAPHNDDNGSGSGSAYVFRFNGQNWVEQHKLLPTDGAATDAFGSSASISGDVILVGASLDDDNGTNSGAAYVFCDEGGVWVEKQKLFASDGIAGDLFGYSVSIDSDVALIGAFQVINQGPGAVYAFRRIGSGWTEEDKLVAPDATDRDDFGFSVAVSGNVGIVGSPHDDDAGEWSGSAYVYLFDGAWNLEKKLTASDAAPGDSFGNAVGISGDTAIVGAFRDDGENERTDQGSAYVFGFDANGWTEQAKLVDPNAFYYHQFGNSVAVSGEVYVVGEFHDGLNGAKAGSAFVFEGSCAPSGCTFHSDCNDFNACTTDLCISGICYNTPISCNDGNACTVDSCNPTSGCLNNPMTCPAGEICVNGSCEPDGCTFNSECNDFNACTTDFCSSGICYNIQSTCNDGNACTDDSCNPSSGCVYDAITCPAGESCVAGQCEPDGCTFNSECNDSNACTTDFCSSGACSNFPISCNDGNACTVDSCNAASGCRYDPISCPTGETCVNGACEPASGCILNSDCNDSNACTWDLCPGGNGTCWNPPISCPDGELCVDGVCHAADGADGCFFNSECNDFNACTTDLCSSGVCYNDSIDCDDSNACTTDSCSGGACYNDPIDCDDSDPCTNDTCNGGGCSNTPIDCDDGDACTIDSCSNGFCFSDDISCDDGDACTDDACFDGSCENTYAACGWADGCCGPSCDGGNDPDCPTCAPAGSSCTSNSDCCSNKCRGKNGNKKCKGN